MPLLFLLIFIVVPLAEIAVFIKVGAWIGLWPTIATVILTAIAGTALLRYQGTSAMNKASAALAAGRLPVESVIDGVSLLLAGAFLLTPGLITDGFGFLLFIPAFRHHLARWLFARLQKSSRVHVHMTGHMGGMGDMGEDPATSDMHARGAGPIIEGEIIPPHTEPAQDEQATPGTRPRPGPRTSPWKR